MSTKTLTLITDNELAYVKSVARDLADVGIYSYYEQEDRTRALNGQPVVKRPLVHGIESPHVRIEIPKARLFIRDCCYRISAVNRLLISHVLRQEATHWLSAQPYFVWSPYISNGAFIAGAILEGYPISIEGLSAYFPLDLTPEYKRLRQLRWDMEGVAVESLARKIAERRGRSA